MIRFSLMLTAVLLATTANVHAGWQYLSLNDLPNDAVLEGSSTEGFLQIRSLDDSFSTIVFEQPNDVLYLDLGAGDDKLTVDGLTIFGFTADIFVQGAGGDDSVVLNDLQSAGSVYVDDMSGNNSYLQSQTNILGSVDINDGPGEQTVRIARSTGDAISGSLSITSTDGGSSVFVGGGSGGRTEIGGGVSIANSGYGDDEFWFDLSRIDGDVYVDHGNGKSIARAVQGSIGGSLTQIVASGQLSATVRQSAIYGALNLQCGEGSTGVFLGDVPVSGGIFINSGLGFDSHTFWGVQTPELVIDNGEGGSRLTMDSAITSFNIARLQVTNLDGSDEINLNGAHRGAIGRNWVGDVEINNGNGNSTVAISDFVTHVRSVRVSAGVGNDQLILDDTTVDGDVIAFHGVGGSDVAITNADIGGQLELDSGDDVDYVTVMDSTIEGPTYIRTHQGDDSVTISANAFFGDFVAEGGAGFDILATANDSYFGGSEYVTGFDYVFDF
ncbi:hypothetical protein [Fuerstiella marisgermanici]|uniref:Uncharacterized protein n=1 Tax=Fuerstiella marisgermanici TaxID=1891926 RepID=A0A1P8WAZ9_9PLAN|nr:hypothetical protein [Fuerstiella marisgermanici]APZ91250.1 hypothetical protein Fuma_00836 [Fuerstiella marisgermanici]